MPYRIAMTDQTVFFVPPGIYSTRGGNDGGMSRTASDLAHSQTLEGLHSLGNRISSFVSVSELAVHTTAPANVV